MGEQTAAEFVGEFLNRHNVIAIDELGAVREAFEEVVEELAYLKEAHALDLGESRLRELAIDELEAQLAGQELDLGLSRVAHEQANDALASCEIALGERDAQLADEKRGHDEITMKREAALKALKCLYIEIPEIVARDVKTKVGGYIAELEAQLADAKKERDYARNNRDHRHFLRVKEREDDLKDQLAERSKETQRLRGEWLREVIVLVRQAVNAAANEQTEEDPPSCAVWPEHGMYGDRCEDCGAWCSVVRPGKTQCDNPCCPEPDKNLKATTEQPGEER